jgi:hypothetical protein
MTTDNKKIDLSITQINILATMKYKDTDTVCQLCRKDLMAPTQEDLSKGVVLTCKISRGKCKHTFHSDCINKFIKNGQTSCPIDYVPWNLEKELDSNQKWNKFPACDTDSLVKKTEVKPVSYFKPSIPESIINIGKKKESEYIPTKHVHVPAMWGSGPKSDEISDEEVD